MELEKNAELLKAVGHPVRLKILSGIMGDCSCNVNEIVSKLGLPQSTVSQHLAILRSKGIIAPQKTGVKVCYKVIDRKIELIMKLLEG